MLRISVPDPYIRPEVYNRFGKGEGVPVLVTQYTLDEKIGRETGTGN
jgi:hypothetical protein